MRTIVILLLLANITLFAYIQLDKASAGESDRLAQQVRPETIRLLTPQQVAALGPAKVAALADVCVEWGAFSDADRARALSELEPLGLGRLLTLKKVETISAYGVYLPKFANKAAADKRAGELTALGLKDVAVVDAGPQRLSIALGSFRTEDAAKAQVQALETKGVAGAQVIARQQAVPQTLLVIRDPEAAVVAKIKSLQTSFPEADTRIGVCDKSG